MVTPPKPGFLSAFAEAALSPMTARLPARRPWLRLIGFVLVACLSMIATLVVLVIVIELVPALRDRMEIFGHPLDETPFRLMEESIQTLMFAVMVGAIALSILSAAALTWRRPLRDFLWPGRRFNLHHFGIGFLVMTTIAALWVPVNLAMGGEWRPPVLDPYYVDHTRVIYAVAMAGALLVGAAAEEVICRGVLLRMTGVVTRRAFLLCLINGVVFSAIHLDPDPVAFIARAISGMGWTWAALRLGGLEFAIGAHFANNYFLTLIWAPFSGAIQVRESPWTDLIPELITMAIVVVFIERLARRRTVPTSSLPPRPAA